jgi:cyclopropane-fatty-acyl-phospholipid synthase
MLELTCRRAEIDDRMSILELGCGWGSLSLWMAEKYPSCRITSVSNSLGQRQFIETQARARGLDNLEVITADMRDFSTVHTFDRVMSVEMFEHMRNYDVLLDRISSWLKPAGKLFVHIFCHRDTPYFFETGGAVNWMGRHFFTGGIMPSEDLLLYFQDRFAVEGHWSVDGTHYAQTCEAWLRRLDVARRPLLSLFEQQGTTSHKQAALTLQRWRMFFMACAELFAYGGGTEWFVTHYLLRKRNGQLRNGSEITSSFVSSPPPRSE